jgi:hypothetical protein
MIFERHALERLLGLQEKSYGLLRWLGQELREGNLSFDLVHGSIRHPGPKDRQRAEKLKRICLETIVEDMGYPLEPELEKSILTSLGASLELSHASYAFELSRRTEFESQGAAVLVLWRSIAWDGKRLKRNFRLTADRVLQAEMSLRAAAAGAIGSR